VFAYSDPARTAAQPPSTPDSGTDDSGTLDSGTDDNGTLDSGTDDNGEALRDDPAGGWLRSMPPIGAAAIEPSLAEFCDNSDGDRFPVLSCEAPAGRAPLRRPRPCA